ncbi:FAD-binding protein [Treponema ruminis]|uniref:Glycolate oxidase n=1 Tax=Treponema ruminis TaxID=744515 RepID=A0A7W8G7L2_9SPIR|nr:FAD-linked oxidase C-terminal domain-containing protein [Treponema ruminis]MBB5225353.1 glycolate oxidase [Treponema ruminis]QSI01776.1 FAD-binding protein [Treponema ruminis]
MADITELSNIISDKNRLVFAPSIEAKYLSDTLGRKKGSASALVFPVSTEEVSAVAKFAYENRIPLTPRGAGTNLVGSTVPHDGAIIIDFSLMNKVLELDKENFTAWVEPGVILEDFQKYVEGEGLFYPPDPGEKRASIGGNISTNAGGMRAVKYGVTRNYVMALELVKADGTVITVGSKNRKDTTGLDLKDVVIGSEGTLAIITKCLLRLIGKPEKSLSLLAGFGSLKAGIEAVPKILKANLNPTALEFIERKVVKLGEDFLKIKFPLESEAYLLLTFDGSKEEIDSAFAKLGEVLKSSAEKIISLDDAALAQNVWRIRGCLVKAVEAVSEQEPLDIVVPISKIPDFVEFVNELERQSGMQMISFGHAGDGNVHLCVVRGSRSDAEWESELHANLEKLYAKAHNLGGLISGEHGLGVSKRDFFFKETPAENVALMNSVKLAFDPQGILNPKISYVK